MNEITKIHLGRQAFTIAVDAHKALQEYLHAIKRAGGDDVIEEVELRMAELLIERGVQGDKVVLLQDVTYLKEQLGEPGAFGDDTERPAEDTATSKRLFRDTQNGMLAGVCAGIAKYLGTDPVLVRLAFVALVLLGASGILLYIVLWLIVPEAKSNGDRLQMQGKPVTVDTLKEVVDRADVKGAAKRAGQTVGEAVGTVLKVLLGVIGVIMTISGIAMLMGLLTMGTYLLVHGVQVNNQFVFPVGTLETIVAICALMVGLLLAIFLAVSGLAMLKRRWPLPGWAIGSLVALFVVSASIGTALALDAVPAVSDRVERAEPQLQSECSENFFSRCTWHVVPEPMSDQR